jgi:hypothetical protein
MDQINDSGLAGRDIMRKYVFCLLFGLCLIALTHADVRAGGPFGMFNGERKGLIVGFGLGPSYTYIDSRIDGKSQYLGKGGLAVDFKLGYGTDDRFQIYYSHKMAMFNLGRFNDAYNEYFDEIGKMTFKGVTYLLFMPFLITFVPFTISHTTIGVGASYYFEDDIPSWFIDLGLGLSICADPYAEELDFSTNLDTDGPGFSLGFGYEFRRHFNVALQAIYANTYNNAGDTNKRRKALSVLLTLGVLGY